MGTSAAGDTTRGPLWLLLGVLDPGGHGHGSRGGSGPGPGSDRGLGSVDGIYSELGQGIAPTAGGDDHAGDETDDHAENESKEGHKVLL